MQGITDIIRGEDLAASTGRQLRLRRMLGGAGWPRFAHHPLILKPGGEKLSKSAADTGVRELRQSGLRSEEVIGRAAAAAADRSVHGDRLPRLPCSSASRDIVVKMVTPVSGSLERRGITLRMPDISQVSGIGFQAWSRAQATGYRLQAVSYSTNSVGRNASTEYLFLNETT